jgi:hypothetical protein
LESCDNTVTTNALSDTSRSSTLVDEMGGFEAYGTNDQIWAH